MKIDVVKMILALALAFLLGFVCKILAPEADNRNLISLAVGFVTIASMLVPAMAVKYKNGNIGVSIKVFAWIMVLVLTAVNILFSIREYKIDLYIVIALLISVIGLVILYSLYKAKGINE